MGFFAGGASRTCMTLGELWGGASGTCITFGERWGEGGCGMRGKSVGLDDGKRG